MNRPLLHPRGFTFPNPRGFTLVELLIALLILGIMSALGYGTYRAARISAERTEESLKRSREIEFGMRVLVMDFAQLVPRPVRDPLSQSDNRSPALRGSQGNGTSAGTGHDHRGAGRGGSGLRDAHGQRHHDHDRTRPGGGQGADPETRQPSATS